MTVELDGMGDPKPAFRWSFSQWESYYTCPAKWSFRYRMKLPGLPAGPAAARGTAAHKRVDDYITGVNDSHIDLYLGPTVAMPGDPKPCPINRKYEAVIESFKNHENGDVGAEKKLGLDIAWMPHPTTSPFVSVVGVLDAYRYSNDKVLHIAEWKTGKPKETHPDQRSLYALFGLKYWLPDEVQVTTYYLENTAPPARLRATPDSEGRLIDKWQQRVEQMRGDIICAPRPGVYCNWCDYAKKRGGPCQFGG